MAISFSIIRNGNNFSCRANGGPSFFVGRRVPYKDNIGLYNIFSGSTVERLMYNAEDFQQQYGFWSLFVEPTAYCEGRNFLTLNTYDRAFFTFGFGQFAAHVPDGDFIEYFRALLALPNATDYFPHLQVINGRIHKVDAMAPVPMETADSTEKLMVYLNPDLDEVQDAEVIAAAKFIHWTSTTIAARSAQVAQMVATFRSFMARADRRLGIDGLSADKCCVIADILHHGRGGKMTWPLIEAALGSANPLNNLIAIGANFEERKRTLRRTIGDRPALAAHRWNRAAADFV